MSNTFFEENIYVYGNRFCCGNYNLMFVQALVPNTIDYCCACDIYSYEVFFTNLYEVYNIKYRNFNNLYAIFLYNITGSWLILISRV